MRSIFHASTRVIRSPTCRVGIAIAAFAFVIGSVCAGWAQTRPDAPSGESTISVNVGQFRNQRGQLGCRLFHSGESFPDGATGWVQTSVPVTGKVTPCTFRGVAPGTYAVSVIHDENGNGKLDKNFLGIPNEGYGASNNHTYALKNPRWSESSFKVSAGKDVQLGIGLRY